MNRYHCNLFCKCILKCIEQKCETLNKEIYVKITFYFPQIQQKDNKLKYVADMVYNVRQTCSAYAYLVL